MTIDGEVEDDLIRYWADFFWGRFRYWFREL